MAMDRIRQALDLAKRQRAPRPETEDTIAERAALRLGFASDAIEPRARVPLDWEQLHERRILRWDDTRPAAHAYRMLRTQVLQRARTHGLNTLGVISAANGEGKTVTAINLAMSLAADPNQAVLLIDLDLKRPSIARTLGLPAEGGLEAWFAGHAAFEDLWCGIEGIDRLFVLPTLAAVPGSSEALGDPRTRRLFQDLKERDPSRLLILDLPPVLLSDDVLMISPLLDAVVLVITEGRTRREDVRRVIELLGGTRVVGTVLNRASESERRAY
jgi:protein-tyrosine kinase